MAFSPGRNVGRLSIRVVPDTKRFRDELRDKLRDIQRTTKMTVNVDKANLDTLKIREDIRRQMQELKGIETDANVRVTVDRVRLKKTALRKSIQDEFDKFDNIRVKIEAEIKNKEEFERDIRDMVRRAERNTVDISANAFTLIASRQIAWTARDRFVNLIVRVSQTSIVKALTTLSALSGARLSWKWIDSLIDKVRELDRNLPKIIGWTTGITSLIAAIFATGSGLVGLGQGLFSITPALLVIPGLLLNAMGSVTALIVALRNAGDELSDLKDDMHELGDIINTGFWGQAREPIVELVKGLMPQLRTAFHDLSTGIGEFTAAMSRAFGEELANGRLASIFHGIAEGWRVLGTGADGFAGALVSLSQIAATYTPRLAGWFVRQANTFDAWLKAIAEDGRLGAWMEQAIDSMYDVWDVTRGLAGVFAGLWNAAEAAGSGGLAGFAKLMLTWRDVVNSTEFQRGLTAVFRGSGVAMSAFGDAIRAIGQLVADLDGAFETFIGTAGQFLGGLIEGAANALNNPNFERGLFGLSSGLIGALEGILPHLPTLGATFGNFLGLLGDLAENLLPTAAGVLAELMPTIDALIAAIQPVLPELADAVIEVAQSLGPAIADFVEAAGPMLAEALVGLADAIVDIAPAVQALVEGLAEFAVAVDEWTQSNKSFFDGLRKALGLDDDSYNAIEELRSLLSPIDDGNWFTPDIAPALNHIWKDGRGDAEASAREIARFFYDEYERTLNDLGPGAANALLEQMRSIKGLPDEVVEAINDSLKRGFALDTPDFIEQAAIDRAVKTIADGLERGGQQEAQRLWDAFLKGDGTKGPMSPELLAWVEDALINLGIEVEGAASNAGTSAVGGFADGFASGIPDIDTEVGNLKNGLIYGLSGSGEWLSSAGSQTMSGFRAGLVHELPTIQGMLGGLETDVTQPMSGAGTWMLPIGQLLMGGLASGAEGERENVSDSVASVQDPIVNRFSGVGSWLHSIGRDLMGGLIGGIMSRVGAVVNSVVSAVQNAVAGARRAMEIHSPSRVTARLIGEPLIDGVAAGIERKADGVRRSMIAAVDMAGVATETAGLRGGGNTINITQPLLPGETPAEQRDNVIRELRWVT